MPSSPTILNVVCRESSLDTLDTYLGFEGLDPNYQNPNEHMATPLHSLAGAREGAYWEDMEGKATLLFDYGADAFVRDEDDETPLHWTARHGNPAMAEVLVRANASSAHIDAVNNSGETALYVSALLYSLRVAEVLVRAGADVGVRCKEGALQPLHVVCLGGPGYGGVPPSVAEPVLNPGVGGSLVKLLTTHNADPNANSANGRSPMHSLAYVGGSPALAAALHAAGANFNHFCDAGWTPLQRCAQRGDVATMRQLFQHGADVDYLSSGPTAQVYMRTALSTAIMHLRSDAVHFLIKHKADVNRVLQGYEGRSMLFLAVAAPLKEKCKQIKRAINMLNYCEGGRVAHEDCMSKAAKDPKRSSELERLVLLETNRIVGLLLDGGAAVNAQDAAANAALHFAAAHNLAGAARCLLAAGADPRLAALRGTPLAVAVRKNSLETVRVLIDDTPELLEEACQDRTVLSIAAEHGPCEMVVALLELGAKVDVPVFRSTNIRAIHYAAVWGHTDILGQLCAYGADRTGYEHWQYAENREERNERTREWLNLRWRWTTPLHFLDVLSPERTWALLDAGADVDARHPGRGPDYPVSPPTPRSLAEVWVAAGPQGAGSAYATSKIVLQAAQRWSPTTHKFYPEPARARARELRIVGKWLDKGMQAACPLTYDLWVDCVMPWALDRRSRALERPRVRRVLVEAEVEESADAFRPNDGKVSVWVPGVGQQWVDAARVHERAAAR